MLEEYGSAEKRKQVFLYEVQIEFNKVSKQLEEVREKLNLVEPKVADEYYDKVESFQIECSDALMLASIGQIDKAEVKLKKIQALAQEVSFLLAKVRAEIGGSNFHDLPSFIIPKKRPN